MANNTGAVSGTDQPKAKDRRYGHKWTKAQLENFRATMKKKAIEKRIEKNKRKMANNGNTPKPEYSNEQKTTLLMEWKRSGLTAEQFSAQHGLTKHLLYNWQHRQNLKNSGGSESTNGHKQRGTARALIRAGHAEPLGQTDGQEQIPTERDIQYQNQICYVAGECTALARFHAESIGVPTREFARRVGELLYRKAHG